MATMTKTAIRMAPIRTDQRGWREVLDVEVEVGLTDGVWMDASRTGKVSTSAMKR